jgi:hypothetical protein
MKNIYLTTILCLILLGMLNLCAGTQNSMNEQGKFIENFLKDKQTSSRVDSDFSPDINKSSDGFNPTLFKFRDI